MTILGKIRQKSWLLIGITVFALVSFLISPDAIEKMLGRDPNVFGEVNGERITREEYLRSLMMMQQQAHHQGMSASGIEEHVWQSIVQSKIIKQEFEKLGLKLTEDFFWNQLPSDPLFINNHNFNAEELKKEIEKLRSTGKLEEYNNWLTYRKSIEDRIMARQLLANISVGITANKKEAELIMKQSEELANIDYVKIDYNTFAEKNKVTVSSQDLADYIKKHPLRFKVPESRNLGIVYFKADPTTSDDALVLDEINQLYNEGIDMGNGIESFKTTKNDSLFLLANSSERFNPNYVRKEYLSQEIREKIVNANIGQTFGPYKEGDTYVVSKLLGKKFGASDSTKSRHILISYKGLPTAKGESEKRTKEEAKQLADSIVKEVKQNPAKFDEYVSLSSDNSSNGGDLGWVSASQPRFVPEFQNYVDNNPKGAVGLVETQFGYHIINITDKGKGAMTYKVANLVKEIKPSEETINKIHSQSTTFAHNIQGKSFNDFINTAKKNNYYFQNPKIVQRFQGTIQGIASDQDEEILKWAFDKKREKGDNEMFSTATGGKIIVYLNEKQEEGLVAPESVRDQIEPIVKNQILAKKIIEKITTKMNSLEEIAKLFEVSKENTHISFVNAVIDSSIEPKVAGAAFGIAKDKLSNPIEGNTGVYIVVNKGIVVNKSSGDIKNVQEELIKQNSSTFPYSLIRSLEYSSDIKDYRIEVYGMSNIHH